ncbi:MAG: hypothetical protein HY013_15930 [Candidatus Solibacter usitatus]|nr:hypothetical protein [Candidatus Solibacter usitatus]
MDSTQGWVRVAGSGALASTWRRAGEFLQDRRAVAVGGELADPKSIQEGRYEVIEERAC